MTIIDLSQPINIQTPVYPGDPPVEIVPAGQIDKDGFQDHKITFGTHVGTHMDALAHMIKDGQTLDEYPIDKFVCPAVCIDATNGFKTESIEAANVQPGDAVLFYTGASQYFNQEKYWHDYKVLNEACCDLLIQKKIIIVSVDTGSVDLEEDFPVHKKLLSNDILIIENLSSNLKQLVGKKFELIALPLKLEIDGAPARVVARF